MLGFSMDQLLVIAAACMLILGPQKTLAAAYWLGSHVGKLKKLLDECKRELSLKDLTGTDLKSEIAGDLADLTAQTERLNADLRNAMRSDALSDTSGKSPASHPITRPENSQVAVDLEHSIPNKDPNDEVQIPTSVSSSADELTARIVALEDELAAIKVLLQQRCDEHAENAINPSGSFKKELEA